MSATRPPGAAGISARVVVLLSLAAFISYVDRGNLGTAGPLIRDELGLTNTEFGWLLSAFFWSYTAGQLPAGWLAERFNPRLILAVGLALWGTATAVTGLVSGYLMLLVLRVLLGCGECVIYPTSFKILAREARDEERGHANGWLAAGQLGGPAFGTLAGGLLMAEFGWRVLFLAAGALSLLWLWPWLRTPRPAAPERGPASTEGPPAAALLRRRELWGSCVGNFAEAYAYYLVLGWLPVYLVKTHGFTLSAMAVLGAGIYTLSAVTAVITGRITDRRQRRGADPSRVRMTTLLAGFAGLAACLGACALTGPLGSVLAMGGCGVCIGIVLPVIWSSAQVLAGPGAAARWMGVQNFFTNFSGITGPVITGVLVDRTGSFASAFVIAAVIALLGMLAFGLIVRRIEPIDWAAGLAREG